MNIYPNSKITIGYSSLAFLLGVLFLFIQVKYPACCDANQYAELGKLYAEKSIIGVSSDAAVRTYFYPLIIGYFYRASVFLQLPLTIVVFLSQFALYIYAVNKLISVVNTESPILRVVHAALIFNLFAYPFFSLTLTDSIYNSLVILWLYAMIRISNTVGKTIPTEHFLTVIGLPGLLSSIIFVVRPAGLWVFATMLIMYVWIFFQTPSWKDRVVLLSVLAGCVALPLIPQVYINMVNYGRVTPFPTFDLGSAQIQWGIEYIKYGTYLGGGDPQMFYRNPFYESGQGLGWYFQNPFSAVGTMLIKLVGAFDYDYLFPYIYDKKPWYGWLSGMASIIIFFLGMWGVVVHAFRSDQTILRIGPKLFPLISFLTWSGVSLASAVELRFTLPMYALLLPLTVERMFFLYRQRQSSGVLIKTWPVLAMFLLLICIAAYVRKQNILY